VRKIRIFAPTTESSGSGFLANIPRLQNLLPKPLNADEV
jgi:hypothetical protein